MSDITITDGLIILAIILGPILAVAVTMFCNHRKEDHQRKVAIFQTLMVERATSWDHIKALNTINFEFNNSKPKERDVLSAWAAYHDLLNPSGPINLEALDERRVELHIDLLQKMSIVLGYDSDRTHIRNSRYEPKVHAKTEIEELGIRRGILEILEGKKPLPVLCTNSPTKKNGDDDKSN